MRVSVIGGSTVTDEQYDLAREVGRVLGERGHEVVCGGPTSVPSASETAAAAPKPVGSNSQPSPTRTSSSVPTTSLPPPATDVAVQRATSENRPIRSPESSARDAQRRGDVRPGPATAVVVNPLPVERVAPHYSASL